MHFSKAALVLLPLVASANLEIPDNIDISNIKVTQSVPTLDQMHAAYPDMIFEQLEGRLEAREKATNVTIHAATAPYRFGAGALAMVGYYALGGGSAQVASCIDACSDTSTGAKQGQCVNNILTASAAHIVVGGGGVVGGKQFIMYFWHAAANQAQAATSPVKRSWIGGSTHLAQRQSCSTQLSDYASAARFAGAYGLKIAGKDFCFQPDAGELGYVQALAANLEVGFQENSALRTDFTVFDTSTSQVVARYGAELDSVRTDLCPLNISGGESCTCSGC